MFRPLITVLFVAFLAIAPPAMAVETLQANTPSSDLLADLTQHQDLQGLVAPLSPAEGQGPESQAADNSVIPDLSSTVCKAGATLEPNG